jgi:hypothetical protein
MATSCGSSELVTATSCRSSELVAASSPEACELVMASVCKSRGQVADTSNVSSKLVTAAPADIIIINIKY